jgi:ankyrin repeat protein
LCASPTHGVTTPLHQASFRRDAAEVGRLLATVEGQGQISVTDVDGHTPLHKAAIYGEEETARLLVQRGAPLEAIDNAGATPLHLAAFEGEEMVVRLMLEAGASREAVGTRGDYQGRTPAAVAHFRGYAALATLLKPTLSDPAIANSTSAGSLHDAAESGDAAAVERLVRGGADVGVRATGGLRNLPYLPPGPELGPEPAPELELEPEPEAEAESEPEPEPTPLQLRVYDIPEEVQASTLKSKQG